MCQIRQLLHLPLRSTDVSLDTISEATITDSNDNPSLVEFARHALRQLDNTEIPKAAGLKVNKLRYCLVRSPSMTDPVATAPKPLQTFLVDQLPDESMCKIWTQAREEENVIEVDFAELAAVKTKEARIRIEASTYIILLGSLKLTNYKVAWKTIRRKRKGRGTSSQG